MTDIIHNYPKSSCDCWEYGSRKYPIPNGKPTNMSVQGSNFSEYYDCSPTSIFKIKQVPDKKTGRTILNPGILKDSKFDQTFKEINSKNYPGSACPGTTYLNSDPRLYNQGGSWLQLDRPPISSSIRIDTLTTDSSLDGYGKFYKSYADINAGHYVYYIDKNTEDSFHEPIFNSKATSIGVLFKDPMGAMKPQFDRVPENKYNPILDNNTCGDTNEYSSFLRDTQSHREDIIALQMRRRNQERYAPRWTNNNY